MRESLLESFGRGVEVLGARLAVYFEAEDPGHEVLAVGPDAEVVVALREIRTWRSTCGKEVPKKAPSTSRHFFLGL